MDICHPHPSVAFCIAYLEGRVRTGSSSHSLGELSEASTRLQYYIITKRNRSTVTASL